MSILNTSRSSCTSRVCPNDYYPWQISKERQPNITNNGVDCPPHLDGKYGWEGQVHKEEGEVVKVFSGSRYAVDKPRSLSESLGSRCDL